MVMEQTLENLPKTGVIADEPTADTPHVTAIKFAR